MYALRPETQEAVDKLHSRIKALIDKELSHVASVSTNKGLWQQVMTARVNLLRLSPEDRNKLQTEAVASFSSRNQ